MSRVNYYARIPLDTRQRRVAERTERRRACQDNSVPRSGRLRILRTDLGLALLHRRCKPGVELSREDIALWAGCTDSAILRIEQVALRKIRTALMFRDPDLWAQLNEEWFNRREQAKPVARRAA